ncbi:hypothetical protein CSH63_05070 [Micromonospora tulbaghiae]|uniref:Uncharacterized protein n=1 Tax=Micromonospora tulbaghiae TaxID=479978 RepID=A0A386WEV6_9ACTN|nr:hypothetical protein [Micromonospora tulbaghiae]AYF26837.1 hypothetical protein CSH63_05070 [Micromonospora tulbaghiae]
MKHSTRTTNTPSQDRGLEEEETVGAILKSRQRNTAHAALGAITAVLGGITFLVWGCIYSDVRHDPSGVLTKGFATFTALGIALVIVAGGLAFTWLLAREGRVRTAQGDFVREYWQRQQMAAIRDAIRVFLQEGDESTARAIAQTRGLLDTGTDPAR